MEKSEKIVKLKMMKITRVVVHFMDGEDVGDELAVGVGR
ncbi:hypothetical protein C5167_041835 [Papaver somniferum]|nr:hypothetical protein C5167_041835 [Papaver somniferum]